MAKLKYFQVFGERNSGTNYLMKLLQANLQGIESTRGETGLGWKHGDIGSDWPYYEGEKRYFYKHRDVSQASDTVVLVIYRNPFTWLQSMHRSPHHTPDLLNLSIDEFISRKWKSYYSPPGDDFSQDPKVRNSIKTKDNLFESFDDVLDLRNKKNEMFEGFKDKLPFVGYINYEALADNPVATVRRISEAFGFETSAEFSDITSEKFGGGNYKQKRYDSLTKFSFNGVIEKLDWDLEGEIGYRVKTKYAKGLRTVWPGTAKNILVNPEQALELEDKVRFYEKGILR